MQALNFIFTRYGTKFESLSTIFLIYIIIMLHLRFSFILFLRFLPPKFMALHHLEVAFSLPFVLVSFEPHKPAITQHHNQISFQKELNYFMVFCLALSLIKKYFSCKIIYKVCKVSIGTSFFQFARQTTNNIPRI